MTSYPFIITTWLTGSFATILLNVLAIQVDHVPITIVPVINLTAIVAASIAIGALFNRVKQLERRVDKTENRLFQEEDYGRRRYDEPEKKA